MLSRVSLFLAKSGTETEFPLASVFNAIRLQSSHLLGIQPLQGCFLEWYHPTSPGVHSSGGEPDTVLKIREATAHVLVGAADRGSLKWTLSLWSVGCSCSIPNASLAPEFLGQKIPTHLSGRSTVKPGKRSLEGLFPLSPAGSQRKGLKIPLTQVPCYC